MHLLLILFPFFLQQSAFIFSLFIDFLPSKQAILVVRKQKIPLQRFSDLKTEKKPGLIVLSSFSLFQLIQARQDGQQRFVVCSTPSRVVTINGQQHILVQQAPRAPTSQTSVAAVPTAVQNPQLTQIQPVIGSPTPAMAGADGAKLSPAASAGFIVVRPSAPATVNSSSATASSTVVVSSSPQIVQTAGGSIILQQPVNPQSVPQQPIIASVRLPNGQTQQILLNTQQVVAHQQLAQLQAMSPQAARQHRLIAPSPRAAAPRAPGVVTTGLTTSGALLPPPPQQQMLTIPASDGVRSQIVRYVTPQGQQAVQVIPVQPPSAPAQPPPPPVPVIALPASTDVPVISIPSSNLSVTAILNNNKPATTMTTTAVTSRNVTVRNLLESRRKTLTPSDAASVTSGVDSAPFPDTVSPVPDVVATQIMTNVAKPPVAAAATAVPPRDVTALTQVREWVGSLVMLSVSLSPCSYEICQLLTCHFP